MNVLVIDVGGTHVKVLATGQKEHREFESGPKLTPRIMVTRVKRLTKDWKFDAISMGYPGPVLHHRPMAEPHNLGAGWVGFDFRAAFKRPVRIINDAAMQALGSYRRGKMLFLGLGTGLGTTLIVDGIIEPMELGHLPYRKQTYEDYVGIRGLKKHGKKKWRRYVEDVVKHLRAALEPDDVVLGGGNVKKLKKLPKGCRAGDNTNAFLGGFRLWAKAASPHRAVRKKAQTTARGKTRSRAVAKAKRFRRSRVRAPEHSPVIGGTASTPPSPSAPTIPIVDPSAQTNTAPSPT